MKLTLNLHSLMRAIEIMEPERSGKFTLELHETHIDKITAETRER